MTPEEFKSALAEKEIFLSDEQLQQFELYYELLVTWNEKMNLTAITAKEEVYLKHFYDSLMLIESPHFTPEQSFSLCDVGSGAGFPSIPLKIVFPECEITIVDSLNKRITFLQEIVTQLKLTKVYLYHDRAETFGQNKAFRESFDYVTARAVARLNVLTELCVPLVKKGGYFIALKAAQTEAEVAEAKVAITLLGGQLASEERSELPVTGDARYLVAVSKRKETPKKYPRKPGLPNKQPLL